MPLKKKLLPFLWIILSILSIGFKPTWLYASSGPLSVPATGLFERDHRMIMFRKNGNFMGYKMIILTGTGSVDPAGTKFKSAKIFARNFSQINTPSFKLQNKLSMTAPDLSFFAPNGFRFMQPLNLVGTQNLLQQTGAWTILKSDEMQDFNILPLATENSTALLNHLKILYTNTDNQPEADAMVILRDDSVPHLQLITLTDIINQLSITDMHYRSLAIVSNRIRIFGHDNSISLKTENFSESLDFPPEEIAYSFDQGFERWPHPEIATSSVTAEPTIQILQWWQDLRTQLRLPESFSYAEQKLLYASLAHMRSLKESFLKEAYSSMRVGGLLLDNELTPKIQDAFFNYMKSLPHVSQSEYQALITNVTKVIKNEFNQGTIRIIFTHKDKIVAARRLAAKDSNNTYVFTIDQHQLQFIPNAIASKLNVINVLEIIKESKTLKSFIFLGPDQNTHPDIKQHNYQQEGLAAGALQTMTTLHGIYPSTIEFVNYFDNTQGEYVARHFEHALTAISVDPLHQYLWPKFATIEYGVPGVRIIRIDHAHLITPLGTLLSITEAKRNQGLATEVVLPTSNWRFLALDARNFTSEPWGNDDHSGLFSALERPLLKQADTYRNLLPRAHGSEQLLKQAYGLHMQSISNSVTQSLPLSTPGKQARQALWRGLQLRMNQLHNHGTAASVEIYLPDLKEHQEPFTLDLSHTQALPLIPYHLLPQNWLLPPEPPSLAEDKDSTAENDAGDGSSDENFDLALNWSSDDDSASRETAGAASSSESSSVNASSGCKRAASSPEGGRSPKQPRLKRSLAESACLPDESDEKAAADRLAAQHKALFDVLVAKSPKIQAFIAAHSANQSGVKAMLEPIIDPQGELRILSYQQGQIQVSDPITHIPQAAKDHIRYFNNQLAEAHQALGRGKPLGLSHFWLAYAAANYAQHGVQTDIRSLLNAAVFFPSLLLESTQLPISLMHQLKTMDILENKVPLARALEKIEKGAQSVAPGLGSLNRGLGRLGSGVMFYNLIDDFLQKPNFSTATSEQKTLWSLNTATDGVFAAEAAAGTLEELNLLALPGAELLGPVGLGLFAITEAVELAYKEQQLDKKLAAENHWLKAERDSFLKSPCTQVQYPPVTLLDCTHTTTPIGALTLNSGQVDWHYSDLRLSKTVLNGYSQNAGEPFADQAWNHSLDLMTIFQSMSKKPQRLAHQAQVIILPAMPNKQIHYSYEDQGVTLDNMVLTFAPLVGDDNLDRVHANCYGTRYRPGTPEQKALEQLKISQSPKQLAYCLELLTHHDFCPEILQVWFGGSSACQVGYMKYDATSDIRMAVRYHYQYHPTEISITLNDDRSYVLVVPRSTAQKDRANLSDQSLKKDDRAHKVLYHIQGNGRQNTLYLQAEFHYQITAQSEQEAWALVIPSKTQLVPVENVELQNNPPCTRGFALKAWDAQNSEVAGLPVLANLCVQGHADLNIYPTP